MSGPRTPEEVHTRWVEATNGADLGTIMDLYESGSSIVDPAGELVDGLDGVRAVTQGLLQLRPRFELHVARVLQSGDIALLLSPWTMTGTADGEPLTLHGTTTDVVRRQADGTWRFVIDNPMGAAIVTEVADRGEGRSSAATAS